jgi:glycosyltransferase involved in cell wall biosynthesis
MVSFRPGPVVRDYGYARLSAAAMPRRRIAVVSPFIDKRHGTERRVAECVSRLADEFEFHVYSNRVEDVDLDKIVWHRVPALPGPHLFAYLWWFAANRFWRWRDRRLGGIVPDALYSPGINCLDADAISVHVVFARFREWLHDELRLSRNPVAMWPQLIHRRLYYRLIARLEERVYRRSDFPVAVVSAKVADDLERYYGRKDKVTVVYGGIDFERFSPERRAVLRESARTAFGLSAENFALLLIGNDWKSKGLLCLLEAVAQTGDPRLRVLVAGRDNPVPFSAVISRGGLDGRVQFLPPRSDVEFFYAAADAYVGPSLEDAFAQPPAESMACGLPVVTSRNNGGAEIISQGQNGFILEDPTDSATLTKIICRLLSDRVLCRSVGEAAAQTALQYTWERNARQMRELFEEACVSKEAKRSRAR